MCYAKRWRQRLDWLGQLRLTHLTLSRRLVFFECVVHRGNIRKWWLAQWIWSAIADAGPFCVSNSNLTEILLDDWKLVWSQSKCHWIQLIMLMHVCSALMSMKYGNVLYIYYVMSMENKIIHFDPTIASSYRPFNS